MDLEEDYITVLKMKMCVKESIFYLLLYSLKFIVLVIPK